MLSRYATSLLALLPFAVFAQTESEPNNTTATANALTFGTAMAGNWCNGELADVFSFTTVSDGYLDIAFDASHSTSQVNVFIEVRLLDANGTDVDGYTATSGPSGVTYNNPYKLYCLSAGNYYLSVQGPANGECNIYTLTATLVQPVFGNDVEPNNTSTQAQVVAQDVYVPGRVNYSYGGDNADWFRFDTPDDGEVQFNVDTYNQNAGTYLSTFELYDDALNSLGVFTFGIGGLFEADTAFNSFSRPCLGQGTYYLRMASDVMCGLSYRVRWHLALPAFTNDAEENDTPAQASTTVDGQWSYGHVNFDTYSDTVDWFQLTLPQKGYISVSTSGTHNPAGFYFTNDLELYDAANNMLTTFPLYISTVMDTVPSNGTRYCLNEGTYYLRMMTPQVCGVSYRIKWHLTPAPFAEDAEDNDLMALAVPVVNTVQQEGHINFDAGDDNSDWYSFWVTVDGSPNLSLEAAHQNAGTYSGTLEWYNESGTSIGTTSYWIDGSSNTSPTNYTPGLLTSGHYFFRITSPVCGLSYRFTMTGISAVGIAEQANAPLLIANPNPSADGFFTLRTTGFPIVLLQLSDPGGRLLRDERVTSQSGTVLLDASDLPQGTYIARLMDADNRWTQVRLVRTR
ncbi:MAG: T9SS type A sorting domain-containing protein [Flavobacteriales bacterium]